jgi:hypothetical protein
MNTVILLVLLLVLLYIFYNNKVESFTNAEMQNYPAMLKENCRINKKLYRQLRRNNKFRCQDEGNTQRDTINNKKLCYDDTGKEINTRLDMISNCAIADRQELITKDKFDEAQKEIDKYKNKPIANQNYDDKYRPIVDTFIMNLSRETMSNVGDVGG